MDLPINDLIVENCRISSAYLSCIARSKNVLSELTEESTDEQKVSIRNRILANEGLDADFMGTISQLPTVTLDEAKMRGLKDAEAEMVIQQRDAIRQFCLELVK